VLALDAIIVWMIGLSIGVIQLDLKRLSEHPECGFILNILHIENDLHQPDMMYSPLRKLQKLSAVSKNLVQGIQFYFIRLQCSQVREGLKVLKTLNQNPWVKALVISDKDAKKSLEYFSEFHPRGLHKADFDKFANIRNLLTFHYATEELPTWLKLELAETALENPIGSVYVPDDATALPIRYNFIDDLNIAILRKHVLQLNGLDAEVLAEWERLTTKVCTNFLTITGTIAHGIVVEFRQR
jgi:hypothetical protein